MRLPRWWERLGGCRLRRSWRTWSTWSTSTATETSASMSSSGWWPSEIRIKLMRLVVFPFWWRETSFNNCILLLSLNQRRTMLSDKWKENTGSSGMATLKKKSEKLSRYFINQVIIFRYFINQVVISRYFFNQVIIWSKAVWTLSKYLSNLPNWGVPYSLTHWVR